MAKKTLKVDRGIKLRKEDLTAKPLSEQGELATDSTDDKLKYRKAASTDEVILADEAQTMTNKTIDATDASGTGSISTDASDATYDDTVGPNPALGATDVQTAIDAVKQALADQNDASEIGYDPAGNPQTTATKVQAALDDTGTAVGTTATAISDHIADVADAHDASAISYDNTTSGMTADESQAAIDELKGEIDTNTTDIGTNASGISDHIADASGAHAGTAISYDNTTSGLVSSDTQAAIDEVDSNLDTHEAATASVHGVSGFVVGTTDTQDLSNKTFIGPVANSIQTATGAGSVSISTTAPVVELSAGITKVFGLSFSGNQECKIINRSGAVVTISNQDVANVVANSRIITGTGADIELKDDAALSLQYSTNESRWNVIGGSGTAEAGSGGINYLTGDNTDFEGGIGDWIGDANISVSQWVSPALRGTGSLRIRKLGGNIIGQYARIPFTIDPADLAKKLTISFDKDFSGSAITDDDFIVEVVKDPLGTPVVLGVSGESITAGKGTHYSQFQTDATELDYELRIKVNSTNASILHTVIDNVIVGPTNLAFGAIVTDPIDYTPILSGGFVLGNGTIDNSWYARNGKFLSGRINITVGTTTTQGAILFTLPSGLQIDSTIEAVVPNYGSVTYFDAGTNFYDGYVFRNTNTQLIAYAKGTSTAALGTIVPTSTIPFTWTSGDTISITFDSVPIQGWSSNTQMSEDLGGRDIVFDATLTSTQNIPTGVTTKIQYNNIIADSTASWDNTDSFIVPESGDYEVSIAYELAGSATGIRQFSINGKSVKFVNTPQSVSIFYNGSVTLVGLKKGDDIYATIYQTSGSGLNTGTSSSTYNWITIKKLASPQTILETETVAARYTTNNGATLLNTTDTKIVFEDLDYDTHNNMVSGTYTVGANGIYNIFGQVQLLGSVTGQFLLNIFIDGTVYSRGAITYVSSGELASSITDEISLVSGQTIEIYGWHSTGGSRTIHTDGLRNRFTVSRIK